VTFITTHRDRWGIEPICRVLRFAPATYHAAIARPPSARRVRDEVLKPEITRVFTENLRVYGADKVWAQLRREGTRVARCTVERLMHTLAIRGAVRGTPAVRTTLGGEAGWRPADLVERQFHAEAPNRLWVADLTYVKTHAGWVYVAFILDVYSRFIVGWQASQSLGADLAMDALEMAIWARRGARLDGLIHHSDRGVLATPGRAPCYRGMPRSSTRPPRAGGEPPEPSSGTTRSGCPRRCPHNPGHQHPECNPKHHPASKSAS
jgi:putative transposase